MNNTVNCIDLIGISRTPYETVGHPFFSSVPGIFTNGPYAGP